MVTSDGDVVQLLEPQAASLTQNIAARWHRYPKRLGAGLDYHSTLCLLRAGNSLSLAVSNRFSWTIFPSLLRTHTCDFLDPRSIATWSMADLLHTRFPRLDWPTAHRQPQVNRARHFIQSVQDGMRNRWLELLAAFQLSKRSVERSEWAFGCINYGFQDEAVGEVGLGLLPGFQGCFENGGGLNI